MKRAIRSVVLAGVIVIISILLSAPQPVRADNSPTLFRVEGYVGHIHLRAQAVMDMDNPASAFYYTFFETRGPIELAYSSSHKHVRIDFDDWNILDGAGESGIYGTVLSGSAGGTTSESPVFSNAPSDTDWPFFTIPFSAENLSFNAQNCWQTVGDACSRIPWNTMTQRISDLATYLTSIKLQIIVDDGNTLSGSCLLPGWDEHKEPYMTYSETCSWTSHNRNEGDKKPEWTREK
jgi:hypothetical protein